MPALPSAPRLISTENLDPVSLIEQAVQSNLDLKQGLVEQLVVENHRVKGIQDHTGFGYQADFIASFLGALIVAVVNGLPTVFATCSYSGGASSSLSLL